MNQLQNNPFPFPPNHLTAIYNKPLLVLQSILSKTNPKQSILLPLIQPFSKSFSSFKTPIQTFINNNRNPTHSYFHFSSTHSSLLNFQTTMASPSKEDVSKETQVVEVTPQSKYSKRVILKSILSRNDGGIGLVGERIVIGGWVKSSKEHPKEVPSPTGTTRATAAGPKDVTCVEILQSRVPLFRAILKVLGGNNNTSIREKLNPLLNKPVPSIAYLQISDGSCVPCLQVVLDSSMAPLNKITPTGTSILVEGVVMKSSVAGKQVIELKVERILHLGIVDQTNYPLAKTRLPVDTLRSYSHFRPRTTTVASVTRIRNSLTHGTHTFFQDHGFLHVHMPVITSTDPKGFSEKFHVTTLLEKETKKKDEPKAIDNSSAINLDVVKASIKEKSNRIEELQRSESNREALALAVQDLQKAKELALQLEAHEKSQNGTLYQAGKMDLSKDFFSSPMFLTVSNQLHLESYASALGSVYTIGPTFSAEKSQSTKHLAEMWMVELEIAFADLEDVMKCAEDYLKFICQWVLQNCSDDLNFVSKRIDKTIIDHLQLVASSSFEKITYTEAVDLLQKVTDKTFESKIEWGVALTDEHESYLTDEIYKRPVIIYNHPKKLKPFFVRENNDGKTVAAFDIVVSKAGSIIRGSQKEERISMISTRIKELGLPTEQYEWYLDLRRHGTLKHSGFSLGFEQMVLFSTGLTDIKDVIPFPRSYGFANY